MIQLQDVEPISGGGAVRPPRMSYHRFRRMLADRLGRGMMKGIAVAACLLVIVITLTLLARAWPILNRTPLQDLLFSREWHPMRGEFGFLPFIVGSMAVTGLALLVAVPPAILSGIYIAEFTSRRARTWINPVISLLAGIPSVIYGLWGVVIIVPGMREFAPRVEAWTHGAIPFLRNTNPTGYGLLAGGLVLALMIFPFITAVMAEVLRSISDDLREALLALGATRWEVARTLVLHQAMPGMVAAVILGLSRAFGETLAVMMVAGNMVQLPGSIFDGVYPLTALIANNYGEMMSIPLYESALMGAALMLLAVILFFNLSARLVIVLLRGKG